MQGLETNVVCAPFALPADVFGEFTSELCYIIYFQCPYFLFLHCPSKIAISSFLPASLSSSLLALCQLSKLPPQLVTSSGLPLIILGVNQCPEQYSLSCQIVLSVFTRPRSSDGLRATCHPVWCQPFSKMHYPAWTSTEHSCYE